GDGHPPHARQDHAGQEVDRIQEAVAAEQAPEEGGHRHRHAAGEAAPEARGDGGDPPRQPEAVAPQAGAPRPPPPRPGPPGGRGRGGGGGGGRGGGGGGPASARDSWAGPRPGKSCPIQMPRPATRTTAPTTKNACPKATPAASSVSPTASTRGAAVGRGISTA